MGQYIWQKAKWPNFKYNASALLTHLAEARKVQGQVIAKSQFIGLEQQSNIIIEEAFTTSAIEGEKLSRNEIRSSVAKRLGLPTAGLPPTQKHIDGLVEALLDATTHYDQPLNQKRIFAWHAGLFPTGYSGIQKIKVGKWRTGKEPMQVISGAIGKEKVHFEAPPSNQIPKQMNSLLKWWKDSQDEVDGIIRAGIAHLWFVTIHPFEDGNGRIARTITDMAIAQDEKIGQRLYSLSSQILAEQSDYYKILEKSQKGNLDITEWIVWFLELYKRAILRSQKSIDFALRVAKFWKENAQKDLNERQVKVVRKLLEAELEGFKGGLTNRKYVSLTKVSRETAKRDLSELEKKGLIKRRKGKGRAVSYELIIE